jgi:cell division protein ZapA (FtsZ GTPase activity inhibitor)
MGKINVSINKKIFTLFCKDGEENRILSAADSFNKKLNELKSTSPSTSSDLLMTICILEIQDQLSESIKKLNNYSEESSQNNTQIFESIKNIESKVHSLTKKVQDANVK